MAAPRAFSATPRNLHPLMRLRSYPHNRPLLSIAPFQPILQFQSSFKLVCNIRCRSMKASGDSETGLPKSVPVGVAHELLRGEHRYLDVRTMEEFNAGHVPGAINIPYMFRAGAGMTKNPNFLVEVSSHFGKDDEIIVGCQSGKRSLMAAAELSSAGFSGITDIGGGFSAWIQNGLPVE